VSGLDTKKLPQRRIHLALTTLELLPVAQGAMNDICALQLRESKSLAGLDNLIGIGNIALPCRPCLLVRPQDFFLQRTRTAPFARRFWNLALLDQMLDEARPLVELNDILPRLNAFAF